VIDNPPNGTPIICNPPARVETTVKDCCQDGAATATNLTYKTGALLFGAQLPERTIVMYGADGQKWPHVAAALQRGLVADGDVTLVLERHIEET